MTTRVVRLGLPLLVAMAACSKPRPRPVPPSIEFVYDTTQVIQSPGALTGTVNVHASGGMDFLHLRLATADSIFVLDTLEGYAGERDITRPIAWEIVPGLAPGTTLHFTVIARDFIGFETLDSTRFKTHP